MRRSMLLPLCLTIMACQAGTGADTRAEARHGYAPARTIAAAQAAQPQAEPAQDDALITSAELRLPNPAFPYYHFRIQLAIDEPSMIDVQASVDGQPLRFVEVRDAARPVNEDRPLYHYRPPMADVYARANMPLAEPYLVGWLAWRPGEQYELQVEARLRQELAPTDDDVIRQQSVTVTAPDNVPVFDTAWRNYASVVVSETAGIDRVAEPVELLLVSYSDDAQNLRNDVRVIALDPATGAIDEVPSQVFDVNRDALDDDPLDVPHPDGAAREVQAWVETTTARVLFQADVPARQSRIYLVYYNNPDASPPSYATSLTAGGPMPGIMIDAEQRVVDKPGYTIENDQIRVMLHPLSGLLHELNLKSIPDVQLEHKMETNGAIHWTPESWPPPRPWSHASDWKEPRFQSWTGPVGAIVHLTDSLPYVPEVDASVTYEVYENQPIIMMSSSTRFRENLAVLAVRNMEMVIRRGLLTHLAWYDSIDDEIKTINVDQDMADLDLILMDRNVPWLTFFNPETGIGFGGVQIENAHAGVEFRPRSPEPYFYITVGPFVYWSHAYYLTGSGKSAGTQRIVEVPQGTHLWAKMGMVLYELGDGQNPHQELIDWQKKLTRPLHVRVVEEVTQRMPTRGAEIYIDPTRTGWEERETGR